MIKRNKSQLALLTTAFISSLSFAGYKEPEYSIPYVKPGFEINVGPVWLAPGASNLNYVIYNKELPVQSPSWQEREVEPDYNLGFELGLRYIFPEYPNKDIRLTWTHVGTSDSASVSAPNSSYFLGPDYEIGPAGIPIRNASGEAEFDYDLINLELGQYQAFGQSVVLRYFLGLSGALLHESVTSTYWGNALIDPNQPPFSLQQNVSSKFNGVGPRFGIGANYYIYGGFGLMGEAALSALIGNMESDMTYTSASQLLVTAFDEAQNYQSITDQDVLQVVPGIETKLGFDYKYAFGQTGLLTLTAGYQAAVYVNAISQYLPGSLVTPLETGGIFVATMNHTLSNYTVQGPFFDVAVHF